MKKFSLIAVLLSAGILAACGGANQKAESAVDATKNAAATAVDAGKNAAAGAATTAADAAKTATGAAMAGKRVGSPPRAWGKLQFQ